MDKYTQSLDMLVRLYNLAPEKSVPEEISIRQAMSLEKTKVLNWLLNEFDSSWADEVSMCFSGHPITCFLAIHHGKIIGFSAYDGTRPGFFGPLGVNSVYQKKGLGAALAAKAFHHMHAQGYAYAVVGWVSPENQEFFKYHFEAMTIESSSPLQSAYKGVLIER